ncbi:MAG: hypothetical protein HY941_11800 [Gammaproteobacteria bacterium]|nr:hypothetical protein [Gammaproteobacteria bacterium]
MPMSRERCASPRAQRGAVGLFGLLVLGISLVFVVLALDTGRLALEKRRLQEVADLAAIDALQQAGPCSGGESMDVTVARTAAQQSAARNGYAGDLSSEADAVLIGVVTTSGGVRQFAAAGAATASAVQVTATADVVRSLVAGGWYGGTIRLQAVAVAQREPLAGFWVGSFLASIDSEDATVLDGVLGGLLGAAVSVNALSYQALVDANVTLEQLIAGAAGIGLAVNDVQGLLDAEVTVADFLSIVATALSADGDATAAAAVNDLQVAAAALGTITIGDLLSVTADNPDTALQSEVNAYALGTAALQLAREGQTLSMPVSATLPLGLGSVDVSLHITDAPQIAVGPPGRDADGNWKTPAHTAQMQLQIDAPVSVTLPSLVDVSLNLSLAAEVARADAWLASIQCASVNQPAHRVTIGAQPGVATLAVGRYNDMADPSSEADVTATATLGGAPLTSITISAAVDLGSDPQDLNYTVSDATPLPQQQTVGTPLATALGNATQSLAGSLMLDSNPPVNLPLLGLTDDLIEGELETMLTPLLTALDEAVLDPVLRSLGANLGGADIELFGLETDESRGESRLVR